MNSLIHKGHSGFAVELTEDLKMVVKWTKGQESSSLLWESLSLQTFSNMEPIRAVPIKTKVLDVDTVTAFMPFINEASGFTFDGNWQAFKFNILASFIGRSNFMDKENFSIIINREIQKSFDFADSGMQKALRKTVGLAGFQSRNWPSGFCHGDFGFANMLVDPYGNIQMIDYTPSFIPSPLVDVATMELSLFSDQANSGHIGIWKSCRALFSDYEYHIDAIRMAKVLSYFRDNDTPERRKELTGMFYGIDRGANI